MAELPSAREALLEAVQTNIIPNQEYLLQGSILDTAVDTLIERLRGLCDNAVDTLPETFHDLEVCLSLSHPNQTTPLMLRVRRALDREAPFHLRYVGQAEVDSARPTLVRSSIDVSCSNTVLEFLTELGCIVEFEFISRGYIFKKGRMKITVSKVTVVPRRQPFVYETITQSHLVELSVVAPSGQDAIGNEMSFFAEQLKPLVHLEKIDYKRLGNIP